jgi:VWFA-related protein
MKRLRLSLVLSLLLSNVSPTPAQQPQGQTPPDDDEVVARITTNLVQLDAVVLDKEGRQVSDLSAEDFEVFEDGRPQKITNFSYVLNAERATAAPRPKAAAGGPPPPPVKLRARDVRRTFALVVDDLQQSFESIYYTRRALRKFVDEVMQPGDLVAIIRVGGGVGALQQFTSDKQILHSAIDHVRVNLNSHHLSGTFGAANDGGPPVASSKLQQALSDNGGGKSPDAYDDFFDETGAVGSLAAIRYVLSGMRELPGRKALLLFSEGFQPYVADSPSGRNEHIRDELRKMIDAAARSSTVIYTMDPRGVVNTFFTASEDLSGSGPSTGAKPGNIMEALNARDTYIGDTQASLRNIANETGGFAFVNNNDLNIGVGRVMEAERGYYLIGYRPSGETFDKRFHKIEVKVKRAGVRVLSRKGFFGITDEDRQQKPGKPIQQLLAALTSPFGATGVEVELTPIFTSNVKAGPYVRSLIHVKASDLTFKDEADGWHVAAIDVFGAAFDDRGLVVQQSGASQQVRLRGRTYERVLRDGLVYTYDVPLKQAGAYQLRFAVRDSASARVGSASQYVEVPNLKKGRLALSGVYMSGTSAAGGVVTTPASASVDAKPASGAGATDMEDAVLAGPAVRRLRPGMSVGYAFVVYNAKLDKATGRPQLAWQTRVFRDGKLIHDGPVRPVELDGAADFNRLAVGGSLQLGSAFEPGEYVLQVIVYDQTRQDKYRLATQWIDFEVVK